MAATNIAAGESQRLHSQIQKEDRTILIALPRSFESTMQRYPVLFLLDGEDHFKHAAATVEFLSGIGRIPEIIVVGVTNNARLRDLSPPTDVPEDVADGTGGDVFLDFLVRELTPWLEQRYRAAPLRILFGHSRGGLINLQALLTRPDAFRAHIAASPYFGWSRERMIVRSQTELGRVPGRHFLYMTTGEGEPDIRAAVEKLTRVLENKASRDLDWTFEPLAGEDHGSTPLLTVYRGLGRLFAEWSPPALVAKGDVAGVEAHYARLSAEYRYTVVPSATIFWELGNVLLENETARRTIAFFERSTTTYPANHYLFDNLGEAYRQAGRVADARRALERAEQLGRDSESAEDREHRRRRMNELKD